MKKVLLPLLLLFAFGAAAQHFTISGIVVDETGAPLPGASLTLLYPWGEEAKGTVAENDGTFQLNDVEQGGYRLQVSYLGYAELLGEVTLTTQPLNVGTLQLLPDATLLGEVEVKEKMPTATQQGDTTSFNAEAFKMMKDASAEDLVAKMPTVTISGGKVQAQGEDVQQVLVDGKPFFGNDPSAALKNLPAEVVQKIQIYDQQSDQSQFTGFDDGNTSKTINIVTRPDMRAGQFGKLYAGYGHAEKYQLGGNVNYFNGDQRLSIIGMSNNINIQNFSTDDLLGVVGGSGGRGGGRGGRGGGGGSWRGSGGVNDFLVSPQGGIATTHALGLNYSDDWGDRWKATGSYFFNNSNATSEERTLQQFVTGEGLGEIYSEEIFASSDNLNHRLNGRLEFELDSMNSFIMRPSLSVQFNEGNSNTFGQTMLGTDLLNQTTSDYFSDLSAVNFSNNLLWRHKFAKKGRTFSANVSTGYSPKAGDSELRSENAFFSRNTFDTLDQRASLDVNSWNVASDLNWTEPLGELSQLMLEYRLSYQQEESDKQAFDFAEGTQAYTDLNVPLSNVFSNDYLTHRPGLGYSYRPSRDLMVMARASFQHATLQNDQTFPVDFQNEQVFRNVLPFAMLRYNIDGRAKNVRVFYRTNTSLPSVEQLQNVLNNSNPLQLSTGNPNLKQSYSHSLFARYQATNVDKSTVFFAMVGGSLTNDYIANATYFASSDNPIFEDLDVPRGAQLTRPVNLDGNRNLRSYLTYGVPLGWLKSNLNIDLNWNYARTPGLIDDQQNFANSHTFGTGLTLSSNISEKVDFTLSGRPSFSRVRNSLQTSSDQDYLSHETRLRLGWIIVEGFVLRSDVSHQLYRGLGDGFNQDYILWNFGIGKKLFKNERGELTLSVNDLLNQNRNIARTVTETYIQDTQTNALTRYVMLTFTYNLRHFNTGKVAPEREEQRPPWMRG